MSESKIQIKIGIVEFAGEGNPEWLAAQLDKILEKIPELLKIELASPKLNSQNPPPNEGATFSLSMVSMASKLNAQSGSDLATAAAAYLRFVKGQASFSREDIFKNMKDATGYYKSSYQNNLTKILVALVKNDTFAQSADNVYSLHVNKDRELHAILSK